MGTHPHIPLEKKLSESSLACMQTERIDIQRRASDNGKWNMVSGRNLSRQTDNKTADKEASKGEWNDFTSCKANRHGCGNGGPKRRLMV